MYSQNAAFHIKGREMLGFGGFGIVDIAESNMKKWKYEPRPTLGQIKLHGRICVSEFVVEDVIPT